jgi:hypothetical protein
MNKLTRSGLNRVGRSVLQFAVSAGFVELVLQRVAGLGLSPEQQVMVTGAVQWVVVYVHRRYLDPSGIPSLVDGDGHAATQYEGLRVAGDGRGAT